LFWYLSQVKQGNSLLEELEDLTEDNLSIKHKEIGMSTSWNTLLTISGPSLAGRLGLGTRDNRPNKSSTAPRIKLSADWLMPVVLDD
jgi:hypothetical protein